MVQAYSFTDGTSDVTDAGTDRWIRLRGKTVKVSKKFQMELITAGTPTDPESFVKAVNDFWVYCRDTRKGIRQGWSFATELDASTAYRMLQRNY